MIDDKKGTDPDLLAAERKTREATRLKKRSPIMKRCRRHFMKTGSAYGKDVFGGRQPRGRCSIRRQNFRRASLSRTFKSTDYGVDVVRIDLDPIAMPSGFLSRDQDGAAPSKSVENDLTALGTIEKLRRLQGLLASAKISRICRLMAL